MILFRALLAAVAFLTRIPVGTGNPPPRVLGLSTVFFPLVGLALGAAPAMLWGAARDHVSPHVLWAVALVGLHALFTGGLHLDGLADVTDGVGGGRGDRDRTLEIMRDSHVGSFGVIVLSLFLMAKVAVVYEVLRLENGPQALLAFPVAARFGAVTLIVFFPYARPAGLGSAFHDHAGGVEFLTAAALAVGAVAWIQPDLLVPAGISAGAALLFGVWIGSRLRGLTGDVYGAAIELAELAFLVAVSFPMKGGVA